MPEQYGDLYIDAAAALAQFGQHFRASLYLEKAQVRRICRVIGVILYNMTTEHQSNTMRVSSA